MSLSVYSAKGFAPGRISAANANRPPDLDIPSTMPFLPETPFGHSPELICYLDSEVASGPILERIGRKCEIPAVDAESVLPPARSVQKLVRTAFSLSILLHGILAVALTFVAATPTEALEEGALIVSITTLGNADDDTRSTGERQEKIEPVVDSVSHPPQREMQDEPSVSDRSLLADIPFTPMPSLVPETLASLLPSTTRVEQPPEISEKRRPEIRPAHKNAENQTGKKAERKPAKRRIEKAGNNGNSAQDARRGKTTAAIDAPRASSSSEGLSNRASIGTAKSSNYLGLVRKKLNRAKTRIAPSGKGEVVISFLIQQSGTASNATIVKSSGNPRLDKSAIAIVAKASPFPAIPEDAGKREWKVTVPIVFR